MGLLRINYESEQPTVSARELHEGLEISERFQSWFNRQLQYGFEENTDYVGCKEFNTLARQELQDYKISIDMAKRWGAVKTKPLAYLYDFGCGECTMQTKPEKQMQAKKI